MKQALITLAIVTTVAFCAAADDAPSLLELQRQYGEVDNDAKNTQILLRQREAGIKALDSLQRVVESFPFAASTKIRARTVASASVLSEAARADLRLLADALQSELLSRDTGGVNFPTVVYESINIPNVLSNEVDATLRAGSDDSPTTVNAVMESTNPAKLRARIVADLVKRQQSLKDANDAATRTLSEQEARRKQLSDDISKRQSGQILIDQTLIKFALPSFAALVVILLITPRLYPAKDIQHVIIQSGLLLELITVFLLTATTLILGISGRIEGDILGTLLGGISGFVLGRARFNTDRRINTAERERRDESSAADA